MGRGAGRRLRAERRRGAVHLELGTWTAFGDERTRELADADGLAELIRLDVDAAHPIDVVADATALPFRSGAVDRVGSNSVLEHIAYPHEVLAECHRVLRPGGVMVHVMPFVWWLHGYPDDYVRLTPPFFERVCREIGFVDVLTDVDATGGLYNTLHNASKMGAVDASRPEAEAMRELHELVALLLGALVPFDAAFEGRGRAWFHSVRVLARKAGDYEPSRRPRAERTVRDARARPAGRPGDQGAAHAPTAASSCASRPASPIRCAGACPTSCSPARAGARGGADGRHRPRHRRQPEPLHAAGHQHVARRARPVLRGRSRPARWRPTSSACSPTRATAAGSAASR